VRPYNKAMRRAFVAAYYGANVGLVVPEDRMDWIGDYFVEMGMRKEGPHCFGFTESWPGRITLYSVNEANGRRASHFILEEIFPSDQMDS